MRVGVLALQGAITEHIAMLNRLGVESVTVRTKGELNSVQALIIPGGESTTMCRLKDDFALHGEIVRRAAKGMPIMGTCAGMILLAKQGGEKGQKLLGLMDMKVNRNAFGRQRESFEEQLDINKIGRFPGVFIRAPLIEKVWGRCRAICTLSGKIVAAEQENLLAVSFHPELTNDTRVHDYFLKKINK